MDDRQEQRLEDLRAEFPRSFENNDEALGAWDVFHTSLDQISTFDRILAESSPSIEDGSQFSDEDAPQFSDEERGVPGRLPPENLVDTDSLAFYLPYHLYETGWGIYIKPQGIRYVQKKFARFFNAFSVPALEQVKFAKYFLYFHELYHNKTEGFSTSLQIVNFVDRIFIDYFFKEYKRQFYSKEGSLEETCANSFAREEMLSKFDKMIQHTGDKKDVKRELRLAINNFFRAQGAGYNQAADTVTDWNETAGRLLTSYSQTLSQHKSQQSHRTHSVQNTKSLWRGTNFPSSYVDGLIKNRVFYFIDSNDECSPNSFSAKYPNTKKKLFFKKLKKIFGVHEESGGKHNHMKMPSGKTIPYTNKRDWVEDYLVQQVSEALGISEKDLMHRLGFA